MKCLTYLALLLSTNVVADTVTVPNTFTSGTPALAAEVNDNFSTITNGINANTAAIAADALRITGNAEEIGINVFNTAANAGDIAANVTRLDTLETAPASVVAKTWRVYAGTIEVGTLLSVNGNTLSYISDKGYAFSPVLMTNGGITYKADLYYSVAGCVATSAEPAYSPQVPKVIFSNAGSKYYTSGTKSSLLIRSKRAAAGGACQSYGITVSNLYKASPNNHVVTGGGHTGVHSFK